MKDRLLQTVKQFLQGKLVPGKPLLVGFSGGPDSLALLHLLIECRCHLEAAHVDHGWRPESGSEAEELKTYVERLGIPLHLHRLEGGCRGEEAARSARLAFFRSLDPQAVLLGHHADDQSETVLKRVLEGAYVTSLGGIRPVSFWEGMVIWRPLLTVSKAELRAWLQEKGLKPLEDPTNTDSRFLRSRMRAEIFPSLAQQFGKEISSNLCRLGHAAREIEEYLDKKLAPYWAAAKGRGADLRALYPYEKLELKTFLKLWIEQEGAAISYAALETLVNILEEGNGRKKVACGRGFIEIFGRVIEIKI